MLSYRTSQSPLLMRHAHGRGFGATHPSAGVRDLGRGWATPRGFRAALACGGARGSLRFCWTDGPSAAKVYSAKIGSSRETRFVANSQDSVISLTAVPPSAFRGSMKPGGRRAGEVARHNTGFLEQAVAWAAIRSTDAAPDPWRARSFWYALRTRTIARRYRARDPNSRGLGRFDRAAETVERAKRKSTMEPERGVAHWRNVRPIPSPQAPRAWPD